MRPDSEPPTTPKQLNNDPFTIIIPARYQSTRLPGKPLLDLGGMPIIARVIDQCRASRAEDVVVATDDSRISEAVEAVGTRAVMTSRNHGSGTDRIAEASTVLGLDDSQIIVNVQGDEPDMPAALIDQVADALANSEDADMATASAPIDHADQLMDPSVVKVVTNRHGHAAYFSRAAIPWIRDHASDFPSPQPVHRRHLGIYAYRAGYCRKFSGRSSCELEECEKLEQLRALWHGETILCVEAVAVPGPGIDTAEDLERARAALG